MQHFEITDPATGTVTRYVRLEREDGSTLVIEAVLTNPEFLALELPSE